MPIDKPQPSPTPAPAKPAAGVRRLSSAALLGNAAELVIEHRGAEYRLRQTATGKLILTK